MQKVFFRTDASIQIGSGHVMRCLTLADYLNENGFKCEFICREHKGNLIDYIKIKGFKVSVLPNISKSSDINLDYSSWLGESQDNDAKQCIKILGDSMPSWLIVDHYGIDYNWEKTIKKACQKLFCIDDLADKAHYCDGLLDQTFGRSQNDYKTLVPKGCDIFTGSDFALLRPEFLNFRKLSILRRSDGLLKKILINLGGVDKDNNTLLILETLEQIDGLNHINFSVVLGSSAPNVLSVSNACKGHRYNIDLLIGVENIAEVMTDSDLAIGAAGATSWERCCLGLPTILLTLAENQKYISAVLSKQKIVLNISSIESIKSELPIYIKKCVANKNLLVNMTKSSIDLVDGMGAERVSSYLKNK